jgi:hypothetical protein
LRLLIVPQQVQLKMMESAMKVLSRILGCLLATLSLVGAALAQNNTTPVFPINPPYIQFDNPNPSQGTNGAVIPTEPAGTTNYNASTEVFSMTGIPNGVIFAYPTDIDPFCSVSCPAPTMSFAIQVDNTGKLIGGNPAGQPDLVVNGQVTDSNGGATYASPLLTGQITQFFFNAALSDFELRFAVTGGSMASLYFNSPNLNNDILIELSPYAGNFFTGSFASNFSGPSRGTLYSTPGLFPPLSVTCATNSVGDVGAPFDSGPITATGGEAPYSYSIVGVLPAGLILNTSTGEVTGTPTATGTFTVRVTDAVGNTSTSCVITINGPLSVTCAAISIGDVGVPFDSGPMTVTGGTAPYSFSIVGVLPAGLTLNTSTGEVSGTPTASGTFTIKVTDATGNSSTSCMITINGPLYVNCAAINTGDVGVPFNSGPMNVSGGTLPYTYSIVGTLPAGLTLNTSTGAVTGTPTTSGTFTVKVTDAVGVSSTSCMITINGPLSVTCAAINTGDVGVPFDSGPMTVIGGTEPYSFSIVGVLPAGLTLNTSTGEVSGTPTASGTFSVQVTDAAGNTSTSCVITINGPLSVTCAAVNTGDVGIPFDSGPMTVMGGTAPYSFSIVGVLPAGLTLNTSTGEVSGTPTSSGTFTVKVTDAVGNSSTSCPITIAGPLSVTCASINTGEVGVPFDSGPMTVTGGTAPYSFSIVGVLPAGLTLNTSTGEVTGTPTASGTFTVKVTDAAGATSSSCAITINGPLSVTCAAINTGDVGVPFNSGPMTVTGGTAPYTYSIVGTLPAGLTLNTSTGAVTGTPTASGTLTVKVTDALGNSSTSCTITINGPLSVTCAAVTTGDVGVPFNSGPMTVTGGTAPYSFSIVGVLPAGLTLNTSTGAITGTPTAAGSFSVKVTDAVGNTSTGCMITINGPLSVTCAAINTGDVGVPFNSGPMTVTGGTAPYSYSIVGVLPAGLTLNTSTGAVTGTPTAAGTFTVKVTDATGNSSTSCIITISGTLSVTCAAINTGEVGVPFSSGPMTVTGGTAPYTYSIVGTLPAGLTLNTSTGAVTGTPTASGTFTVKVTDAVGNSATSCMITIHGPLSVTCAAINTGDVGLPFNSGPMTVTGGTAPYTYSIVGTLPAGLTLNTSTGAVTGTPTAAGTFTVKVTDALGNSSTSCMITINTSLSLKCAAINAGVVGVAFNSGPLTVTGGTAPYTYSIVGTLPAGLTLNTSTGAVTGTPTAAGSFSVQVTDAKGAKSTTCCSITIAPAPSATCVAIVNAAAGEAITPVQLTGSGGSGGPYTFSATGLPAGLTMSSSGTISGTPTATGTFNYTVTIKDNAGHTGTVNCSVTIAPPVSTGCVSITAMVGVPITPVQLTGSGGTAPYTFSATGLPPGLTLSSSGLLSGTPTQSGTFKYTVTISDSAGHNHSGPCSHNTTLSCSITVLPGITASCVSIDAVQYTAIKTAQLTATGGTGPYTFSATGLPAGLTMSSSGAISGTPTVNGTFNYTVTIKDKTGHTGTLNCSVKVLPPVTATGGKCGGQKWKAISPVNLSGSGGAGGPYSFKCGSLPPGLNLSSSGTISGTPSESGTFNFTIQVTDCQGHTGSVNYSASVSN